MRASRNLLMHAKILYNNDDEENEDNIFTHVNSKYYDLPDINDISIESSL